MKHNAQKRSGPRSASIKKTNKAATGSNKLKPWQQAVGELTETLLSYHSIVSPVVRERQRTLFYAEFQRMSLAAAMSTLATKSWNGDKIHVAEEIVSSCLISLLRQEQSYRGLFQKTLAPFVEVRSYLSQVIWRGVQQQARDYLRKERHNWNHESLAANNAVLIDKKVASIALHIDLKNALEKVTAEEKAIFNLPGGVIPLDLVLRKEIASSILSQVPKRSWQRYAQQSRKRMAKELGYPC
jgi:hypothetical protein